FSTNARPYELHLSVPSGQLVAGHPVRLGNRSQPPLESARLQLLRAISEVIGHGVGGSRERRATVFLTPGSEILPVSPVGPSRVLGLRFLDVARRLRADVFQACRLGFRGAGLQG